MRVRQVYRPEAAVVAPYDSLRDAAIKMRASGQSCLPVLDGDSLEGIVTERDLVEAVAKAVPTGDVRVRDYCHDGSVTVSIDEDCDAAELKMLAIGCRNLPVVHRGRVVGMISMRDAVLKATALAQKRPVQVTWPYEPAPDVDSQGEA